MSEQDVKTVSTVTGTYSTLRSASAVEPNGGNVTAAGGKNVPVREQPDMEKLVGRLNQAAQSIGRDLRFQVDLERGLSVIQVLDRETGEIIRQIPPENARTYLSEFGDVALRLYDAQV